MLLCAPLLLVACPKHNPRGFWQPEHTAIMHRNVPVVKRKSYSEVKERPRSKDERRRAKVCTVAFVVRLSSGVLAHKAQPALAHAHEAALPDHKMIEHVDVKQLASRNDLACHKHILRAGRGVAGGVIVDDN